MNPFESLRHFFQQWSFLDHLYSCRALNLLYFPPHTFRDLVVFFLPSTLAVLFSVFFVPALYPFLEGAVESLLPVLKRQDLDSFIPPFSRTLHKQNPYFLWYPPTLPPFNEQVHY